MREGSSANHHAAKSVSEKNTQGAPSCQPSQTNPPAQAIKQAFFLSFFLFLAWRATVSEGVVSSSLSLAPLFLFFSFLFLPPAERLKLYGLQVQQPTSQEDESLFVSLSIQVVTPPRPAPLLPPTSPLSLPAADLAHIPRGAVDRSGAPCTTPPTCAPRSWSGYSTRPRPRSWYT